MVLYNHTFSNQHPKQVYTNLLLNFYPLHLLYVVDIGTYQGDVGKTKCEICDQGKYSQTAGESVCKDCGIGLYNDKMGGYDNDVRPEERMVDEDGECQVGQTCSIGCIQCKVGQYGKVSSLVYSLSLLKF